MSVVAVQLTPRRGSGRSRLLLSRTCCHSLMKSKKFKFIVASRVLLMNQCLALSGRRTAVIVAHETVHCTRCMMWNIGWAHLNTKSFLIYFVCLLLDCIMYVRTGRQTDRDQQRHTLRVLRAQLSLISSLHFANYTLSACGSSFLAIFVLALSESGLRVHKRSNYGDCV